MTKSVHNLYKDIEALRIANAMMTQIDYDVSNSLTVKLSDIAISIGDIS